MQQVCEQLHSEGYAIVRGFFGAQDMAGIAQSASASTSPASGITRPTATRTCCSTCSRIPRPGGA